MNIPVPINITGFLLLFLALGIPITIIYLLFKILRSLEKLNKN